MLKSGRMKKQVLRKVFEALSKSCGSVMEQTKVGGDHRSSSEACVKALVLSETISRHNCKLEWVSDQRHRWQKIDRRGEEAFALSFLDIWTVTMIVMKEQRTKTREGVGWNGENKEECSADRVWGERRGGHGGRVMSTHGGMEKWWRWKKRKSTSEEERKRRRCTWWASTYITGFHLGIYPFMSPAGLHRDTHTHTHSIVLHKDCHDPAGHRPC